MFSSSLVILPCNFTSTEPQFKYFRQRTPHLNKPKGHSSSVVPCDFSSSGRTGKSVCLATARQGGSRLFAQMCIRRPYVWITKVTQAKPNATSWSAHRSQAIQVGLVDQGNPTNLWRWRKPETSRHIPLESHGMSPPAMQWSSGWLWLPLSPLNWELLLGLLWISFPSAVYLTQCLSLDSQTCRKIFSCSLSCKGY